MNYPAKHERISTAKIMMMNLARDNVDELKKTRRQMMN